MCGELSKRLGIVNVNVRDAKNAEMMQYEQTGNAHKSSGSDDNGS